MRSTVTISLPEDMLKDLKKSAKKAGLSVSEFFQKMFTHQKEFLTEDELLERSKEAMQHYRSGNSTVLTSADEIEEHFTKVISA